MSDQNVAVATLREQVREFVEERDWNQFHSAKDLAIGLSIEAAELLEHFRFKNDNEIETRLLDPEIATQIKHELADVFYFVLALSNHLEIDLSQAFEEKLAIAAQKYPVELAKGRNLKYTELEQAKQT